MERKDEHRQQMSIFISALKHSDNAQGLSPTDRNQNLNLETCLYGIFLYVMTDFMNTISNHSLR